MTGPIAVPPQAWRVIGSSPNDVPESFIPMNPTPRSRAILHRLLTGPTPEERKRWGREAARRESKRRQALAADIDRHARLVVESLAQPVVTALLEGHGPHLVEVDSKQYAECRGCPTYWTNDPFDESYEERHGWPCPTWTTIAEQTEGAE